MMDALRNEMLDCALALSHVPRWTTHYVTRQQHVDSHSYRVAVIALAIRDALHGVSAQVLREGALLRWALVHDTPEAKTGDIPSPMKNTMGPAALASIEFDVCPWYANEDSAVNAAERMLVSIADSIEALSWIRTYGHGAVDRFDGKRIEDKLRHRVHIMAVEFSTIVGLEGLDVVQHILGQVAP